MDCPKAISRRRVLAAGTAGIVGAALPIAGQNADQAARPKVPADPTKVQGPLATDVGGRSPFEKPKRVSFSDRRTSSLSPLQDLDGIITPSDLHFERHHGGVPAIDPKNYSLLIHGMVDRPLVFTLDDLRRFPGKSIIRMMECSGNGGRVYRREGNQTDLTPQQIDGLTSTSEWTGVPLATLLREAGASTKATWFLAEGMDAAVMTRSIPIAKAWDDALIAYGQNGEALRPEQGYPVRLFLPGVEGNASIKWLRRIELADQPFMTREETSKYTDPLPDGTARMFSLDMDAKSLITEPSFPDKLTGPGWWEIRGIAWTGRGKITRVEISTDGGKSWQNATLDEPVLPKCHTRFRFPFEWKGSETIVASRATDESGYVQPTYEVLLRARGPNTAYHFNNIRGWKIHADGTVKFAGAVMTPTDTQAHRPVRRSAKREGGRRRYMFLLGAIVAAYSIGAFAQSKPTPKPFGIGRVATAEEIKAIDIDVMPDGRGLPAGSGTVAEGAKVYAAKCASCHGKNGEGASFDRLVATDAGKNFDFAMNAKLPRAVGNYWPYATTLYDYTYRAMPFLQPGTLTANETYSLVAYILALNKIVPDDAVMDAKTLPAVKMPARDLFVIDNRKGGKVVK